MKNEVFEKIIRSLAIEDSKKKKDIKKKKNDIKKLNEENAKMMQMVDGMKDRHEEKLKANEIDPENAKITVAETESCTEMATKEEHNKEIER